MPIPFDQIYRDAADYRITWHEALVGTMVIDSKGDVLLPSNEQQKYDLHRKAKALRHYSIAADNGLLKDVIKRIEITVF